MCSYFLDTSEVVERPRVLLTDYRVLPFLLPCHFHRVTMLARICHHGCRTTTTLPAMARMFSTTDGIFDVVIVGSGMIGSSLAAAIGTWRFYCSACSVMMNNCAPSTPHHQNPIPSPMACALPCWTVHLPVTYNCPAALPARAMPAPAFPPFPNCVCPPSPPPRWISCTRSMHGGICIHPTQKHFPPCRLCGFVCVYDCGCVCAAVFVCTTDTECTCTPVFISVYAHHHFRPPSSPTPITSSQVWDTSGSRCIRWHASDVGADVMGYVVENSLIQASLLRRYQEEEGTRVECLWPVGGIHWCCVVVVVVVVVLCVFVYFVIVFQCLYIHTHHIHTPHTHTTHTHTHTTGITQAHSPPPLWQCSSTSIPPPCTSRTE